MTNIAIFASGSGTNAENILNYFKNRKDVRIALILCNKADAFVLQRAKNWNVDSKIFNKKDLESSTIVLDWLSEKQIDFIVLAGFLLKVPDYIINAFPNRIVNIHPALLPKYGGKGMYGDRVHEAVVANHETESGITIHYVNNHYDEGAIIFQAKCQILPSDSPHDVATKVHALEYAHFPEIIDKSLPK